MVNKLKTTEIRAYREQQLINQNNRCALCEEHLPIEEAVLDHNHSTGYIRGVLHRGCNALEGKIARSLKMNRITPERLRNIVRNLENYTHSSHPVLHPSYKTAEERKLLAKARAKKRRATK